MKRCGQFLTLFLLTAVTTFFSLEAGLRNKDVENTDVPTARSNSNLDSMGGSSEESAEAMPVEAEKPKPVSNSTIKRRAEAFIAGAEWEFDGFVAGGQDQEVKSMFATNDLVYLNVGSDQGLKPGERLGFYRRGNRVRDPQTGRMLGFEVRKLGVGEVTDLIEANTCSLRVIYAYESVEIGDLVRKE